MDKEQSEKIALFRFGVIGDFVNQNPLPFGMQERLIRFKSNCKWNIPCSKKTQISREQFFVGSGSTRPVEKNLKLYILEEEMTLEKVELLTPKKQISSNP